MSKRTNIGIHIALITSILAIAPAFAQYYGNPYYANPTYVNPYYAPNYNNYGYRGYAPYGYGHYHNHTVRNVAVGAGIGALVGLLASPHGHRY